MSSKTLLDPGYIQARKFGIGPDFAIYTGGMKPAEKKDLSEADQESPILRMIGSSTVQDLQGDIMTLSALQDMTTVSPDLLLYLNHTYDLPDSVFAKLHGVPSVQMHQGIADLWLSAEVILSNPPAAKTYNYIVKDKLRLGCSIGCQVLDWEFADPDDMFSPIYIKHVFTVEFSVVAIPANQRCWVENAIKGLFARQLVEGNADEALRLAPAFKGLYSRDFNSVVENVTSTTLRKDLQHVQPRNATTSRIMYTFDGEEGFYLDRGTGTKKSLTRDETAQLLERTLAERDDDLDATKSVSGKTSWPLMDIGTEWTGSKAEKQIFEWAGGDDFSASKAKQGFLYYDPDNSDKRSGFKMPFVYVDGSPKIVPLGVRACAGALSGGGREVSSSAEDKNGMKAKVKTMYGRINSKFHPDPEWQVPWEKDEKSLATHYVDEMAFMQTLGFEVVEQGETFFIKSADGELTPWLSKILDTENGGDLIRQDLEDEVEEDEEKTKGVTINDDGSHEKMTGKHSHKHKAFNADNADGDGMHGHEHAHDDDADHHHSHADAEKHEHPHTHEEDIDKQAGVKLDADGNHEPYDGTHSHKHKAFGADNANDDGKHSHSHDHDSDSNHKHSHSEEKAFDPIQQAYLTMYNDLGKKLGFPEHTMTTKCDLVPTQGDAGIVRSMLSALDDCSDSMMDIAQRTDGYVDTLMGIMGVPDTNDAGDGSASAYPSLYSLELAAKSLTLLVKEGKELSGKNASLVQNIHDTAASLHPPVCKGVSGDGTAHQGEGQTVQDAQAEARAMGQGQGYDNMASLNAMGVTVKELLTKSFEGLNVKALVEKTVHDAVDAAMAEAHANMDLLQREQQVAMHQVARLKNVPLGRPTNLSGRTVVPKDDERVATYEEMLSAGDVTEMPGTLKELEAYTEIVEKQIYVNGGQRIKSRYRRWPESVGGLVGTGLRPPLTGNQRSLMLPEEWSAYSLGAEVDVPLIDDPFVK